MSYREPTSAESFTFIRLAKDEVTRFEEGARPDFERRRAVLNKWWDQDYKGWRSAAIAEVDALWYFTQGCGRP